MTAGAAVWNELSGAWGGAGRRGTAVGTSSQVEPLPPGGHGTQPLSLDASFPTQYCSEATAERLEGRRSSLSKSEPPKRPRARNSVDDTGLRGHRGFHHGH